jgi:hypothetical protein
MKIDQFNNFTADKINDVLESRFGQRIDLSSESLDNLQAFQHAIARELEEMEHRIGFNKSMQNPKFVENRMILDLISQAIDEKKGKDHDKDGDIDSDDYLKSRDIAIKKAMGKDDEDKKDEDAKVKMVRGNKIDIEDPDKPGQTTTIDTTKADVDVDDSGAISIDADDKADTTPAKQKIRPGQTVKMETDDLEDVVADEFEDIIHMLKQGMSPDDIKKKYPKQADTVDQVVKDLQNIQEAMNSVLPEGKQLTGTELSALRLLVGTNEFMRAKRAIELARAGRAIPSDLVQGLKPLFNKIGTFLSAGAGAVKRFGDIEKMIGRTVKNGAYEDKLNDKLAIKESEMDKAEVTLAAKDMVDKIDAMIEDVGQIKSEELLPLVDKVRDEVGQAAADTLKSSVDTAMADLETALQSARSSLDNAARTVAGDPSASDDTIGDPMNDEPMPDADLDATDDSLNSLDVPDAEVGGEDPEGREKRESVERSKHQIAESIYNKLAGKK